MINRKAFNIELEGEVLIVEYRVTHTHTKHMHTQTHTSTETDTRMSVHAYTRTNIQTSIRLQA